MSLQPLALEPNDLRTVVDAPVLFGQLISQDPDGGGPAEVTLLSRQPPGFALQADGRWSFDPSDSAYDSLAPGASRLLTVVFEVKESAQPPWLPSPLPLPNDVIRVGGPASPWATLQQAIDAAPAGAVLWIAPGTYEESLTIRRDLTLLGANQGIAAGSPRGPESVIRGFVKVLDTAETVTFDGLSFAPSGNGSNLRIEAASSQLRNSIITSGPPSGGYAYPAFVSYAQQRRRVEVENNLFAGILDLERRPSALRIFGSDSALIRGNIFNNTGGAGNIGTSHVFHDLTIENNLIRGGGQGFFYYNQPIWTGRIDTLVIRDNTMLDVRWHGIGIYERAPIGKALVSGNLIGASDASTDPEQFINDDFVNLYVLDPAQSAQDFTVVGNELVNPWNADQRVVGLALADLNDRVVRSSSIGTFSLRIEGRVPSSFRDPSAPLDLQPGRTCHLPGLRDFDGILHGGAPEALKDSIAADYRFQGLFSLRRDGLKQAVFTNRSSGRWASAAFDPVTRQIDYADNGQGGITRVVGIYIDILVAEGEQNTARPGFLLSGEKAPERGGPFDSQRRFQNDLNNDNLSARFSGDFDNDGIQELYWKVNDGTSFLRSLLHDDGNIRYANYQSRDQMTSYLTSNGNADLIASVL